MIGRLRTRDAFQRLRRDGQRVRSGALWCTFVLDSALPLPQVAFAIGRPVGSAVTRNRVRRRLRALLAEADLPAGLYLVGGSPAIASQPYAALARSVDGLARNVTKKVST